jgi:hypothetical protein
VSHYNNSSAEAPLEEKDSHFHCDVRIGIPYKDEFKIRLSKTIYYRATKAGLSDPKVAVAAAITESGLNEVSIGDGGCSLGLLQLNYCVHGKKLTTDQQIDAWIDNFKKYTDLGWSWQAAVVSWNCPACGKNWEQTKYWKKYSKIYNAL